MAYNQNTPQATDPISATQQPIKVNFQEIANALQINHGSFNGPDQGKHTFIQMPEQAAAPATAANELAIYSKESSSSGVAQAELFLRRESNGQEIEMTGALLQNNGWTMLPSGILMKWGQGAGISGLATITFPTGPNIPVFADVYSVNATTSYNTLSDTDFGRFVRVVDWNNAQIRLFSSYRTKTGSAVSGYTYIAMGIPV